MEPRRGSFESPVWDAGVWTAELARILSSPDNRSTRPAEPVLGTGFAPPRFRGFALTREQANAERVLPRSVRLVRTETHIGGVGITLVIWITVCL